MPQYFDNQKEPESAPLTLPLALREGAYGVLLSDGKVLLSHTQSGSRTIVNFPGGAIDAGETPESALIREVKEEAGGAVIIIRHLYSSDGKFVNPDYPKNRMRCHYYLIREDTPLELRGNSADVKGLEWFPMENLPLKQMLEVDADFCRDLPRLLGMRSA